jgi:prolyl 4-hydroxylase
MQKECAPVCFTCALALLTFEERCPLPKDMHLQNAWQNGDLHRMFERIVNDEKIRVDYGLTVLLHPGMTSSAGGPDDKTNGLLPWVVTLDTFLSDQECEMLIQHGHRMGFEQSGVSGVDPKDDITRQSRTSATAWCRETCYQEAAPVLQRIEQLTGIPQPNYEHLQVLMYDTGGFYVTHRYAEAPSAFFDWLTDYCKTHSDYIPLHLERAHGPRVLTVFLYLNDVEQGKSPLEAFTKRNLLTCQ